VNPDVYVLWAAAIATLGVYTILHRENPISRLFEHIFVGLSAGYLLVATWTLNLEGKWWAPMIHERRWYWIFAPIVGFLFYFIYSRRLAWLARLVMGLFIGAASGTFFRQFFPLFAPQVTASFKSVRAQAGMNLQEFFFSVVLQNWLFVTISPGSPTAGLETDARRRCCWLPRRLGRLRRERCRSRVGRAGQELASYPRSPRI